MPDTGIPILKSARNRVTLAVCEPEPLTVARVIEKSLIIFLCLVVPLLVVAAIIEGLLIFAYK